VKTIKWYAAKAKIVWTRKRESPQLKTLDKKEVTFRWNEKKIEERKRELIRILKSPRVVLEKSRHMKLNDDDGLFDRRIHPLNFMHVHVHIWLRSTFVCTYISLVSP